jgi:hypothetical protein
MMSKNKRLFIKNQTKPAGNKCQVQSEPIPA